MIAWLQRLRSQHWDRQKHLALRDWAVARHGHAAEIGESSEASTIVFLCEEFFHPDLRGFGGFGKTVKNIAEHYNSSTSPGERVALALSQVSPLVTAPEVRRYHGTDVVLRPRQTRPLPSGLDDYAALLGGLNARVMISIDGYPTYAVPAYTLGTIPLIIWIHDPRDRREWELIAEVPDELRFRGLQDKRQLVSFAAEKQVSIERLFAFQRLLPRKIVFETTA